MKKTNLKSLSHRIRCLFIVMVCVMMAVPIYPQAASASSNVTKMLNYYKNKEYAKADKIGKKYAKKLANEKKYRKQLSSKARKAYKKVLRSYSLYDSNHWTRAYLWNYFVKDLDGKGMPELCIYYGSCEADVRLRVYGFNGGKAKMITQASLSHSSFSDYPGKKGVVCSYGHMGSQGVSVLTLKNKKISLKSYGGHNYASYGKNKAYDYIDFPYNFPSHVEYKHSNKGGYHSYTVLSYSGVE